jgi:hypothetical protein
MNVDTLPVLYDPEMIRLQEQCAKPIEVFTNIPIEQQLDDYSEDEHNQEIRSGILEGLYTAIKFSDEDYYNTAKKPNFTGKFAHDNMVRQDIDNYYNERVPQQAEEIFTGITALIQRDGWNPKKFGNYEMFKIAIGKHTGLERAMDLYKLRTLASTAIPMDVKYQEPEIIEPSITSPIRTN